MNPHRYMPASEPCRHVNVLMCGNTSYFQHMAVCLLSLLDSNADLDFNIVIVSVTTSETDSGKLRCSLQNQKNLAQLTLVTLGDDRLLQLPTIRHYPHPEVYARFLVEEFFSDAVERVLYLDADMIVTGSISELLHIGLGDDLLAAVSIPGSTRATALGYDPAFEYFNSGVMVINLPLWRDYGARDILIKATNELADKMNDADQCVLNYCLHARRRKLDYIWNVISPFFRRVHTLSLSDGEIARVVRDARIVHFNGASKPWHYMCMHPHKGTYLKYLARTEWRDVPPVDRNAVNFCKKSVHRVIGERNALYISRLIRNARG